MYSVRYSCQIVMKVESWTDFSKSIKISDFMSLTVDKLGLSE